MRNQRILMVSRNLIGDGLNIYPALKAWWDEHQDWEITMYVHDDHSAPLYEGMGILMDVRRITNWDGVNYYLEHKHDGLWENGVQSYYLHEGLYTVDREAYDFIFNFDVSVAFGICDEKKIHITEGYAEMLHVKIPGPELAYLINYEDPAWLETAKDLPEEVILVSAFSRSCSSQERDVEGILVGKPPNKMLPWDKWKDILDYLRTFNLPIRFLGSPEDIMPASLATAEEHMIGVPQNTIAAVMRNRTKLLVTIDNGMSHLAATQHTPTLLFYPACLGSHFIVSIGNPNVRPIHMDPANVTKANLMSATRKVVSEFL